MSEVRFHMGGRIYQMPNKVHLVWEHPTKRMAFWCTPNGISPLWRNIRTTELVKEATCYNCQWAVQQMTGKDLWTRASHRPVREQKYVGDPTWTQQAVRTAFAPHTLNV